MGILEALSDALTVAHYDKRDEATIALAAKLAQEIDAASEPRVIGDLATRLLAVLNALGLTPMARIAVAKGVSADVAVPNAQNTLDELRARRQRPNGTEDLHSTD